MTETVKRIALFFTPTTAHVHWVTLDQTGQPPRVVEDIWIHRFELVSLDDAPLAIYRADTGGSYERDALAALAELVRVVNGEPNVSVDVDESLRQLREQLRATVDNAETLLVERDATIERITHQNECIRQEARRWKSKANAKLEVADYWEAEARRLAEIATERDAAASAWEVEATQRRSDVEALLDGIDRMEGVVTETRAQLVDAQANALRTIDRLASALPADPVIDAEIVSQDFEINPCFSDGDIPTVEISSWKISGRVRVVLDNGVIWDGDPTTDNRPGGHAKLHPWENITTRNERELTETISRQLDTIRDQADMIESASEKIEEAARNLSQATAERAEAWRDLDKLREERDAIHNERANLLADNERLREILSEKSATVGTLTDRLEAEMAETAAAVRARDEADAMRRKLDARLGEERDAYVASSTALQSVIRQYDGLAQYGANLARAVTAERPDLSEAGSLGREYLREMATRFGA